MKSIIERFVKYCRFNTQSNEESATSPSTPGQIKLAELLAQELRAMKLQDISLDENGYVMAMLPSNISDKVPAIGFIAHMDTSPDMSGNNVSPRIIENYDGNDIILHESTHTVLSPKDFPELKNYIGQMLITGDGTTLLGADDKAGIAEIMTALEFLTQHQEFPHGDIYIAFTPDEEIGKGTDHFDMKKFRAEFAYTVDGGPLGELEYENFNAAGAKIHIQGTNVHPGTAKGIMKNSILIGMELAAMFPPDQTPAHTEGYEGFYHLNSFHGDVESAKMEYIIRDFDRMSFETRKDTMRQNVRRINDKYGCGTAELNLYDQYYNMREKIEEAMHVVDIARRAMVETGVTPVIRPIRGGTDGARLSFMGIPTPNLFTGGHNFHGKYEYIPVPSMEKAVAVILRIIELYSYRTR